MTIPYTYLLIFLPTGQLYYGVQFKENCNPTDLFNTYFTSSKIIKKLIEDYGVESFRFEIRKIFQNKKSARDWEQRLLIRINAAKNPKFLNQSNNMKGILREPGTYSWYFNPITYEKLLLKNSTPTPKGFIKGKRGPDPKQKFTSIITEIKTGKAKRIKKDEEIPTGYTTGRKDTDGNKIGTTTNTKWICNDITNETQLLKRDEQIPAGWKLGNKNIKNKNRIKIYKDHTCKSINQSELTNYLNSGWKLGSPKSQYIKIFRIVNDEFEVDQIHPMYYNNYKNAGWFKGLPILYKIYFTDGRVLTYPYQWFVANLGISKDMILYAAANGGVSHKFKFKKVERIT